MQCISVRRRLASVFASIELSQKLHADTCKLIRIRRRSTRMAEKQQRQENEKDSQCYECEAVDRGNARRKIVVLNFEEMRDVSKSIYCRCRTMVVWVLKRSLISRCLLFFSRCSSEAPKLLRFGYISSVFAHRLCCVRRIDKQTIVCVALHSLW